jgi:hypothetical protein
MSDQSFPITPPPFELVSQWHKEACKDPYNGGAFIESKVLKYITTAAAQWGADQELEACHCEVSFWGGKGMADRLQATRRPRPPSLKEQALASLEKIIKDIEIRMPPATVVGSRYAVQRSNALQKLNTSFENIRRALEALPND